MDRSQSTASTTQRGHGLNILTRWVLLAGPRWMVVGGMAVGCFALLIGVGWAFDLPLRAVMRREDTVETLFQTLIAALITGITLVVTLNQTVLSQEFGSIGRQRDRMDKSMTFRRDVGRLFGSIGPPEPDAFLQRLVDTSTDRATALKDAIADNADPTLRARIDQFADHVVESATGVADELENAQFGEFTVMRASLAYNYSWKIYIARRLRSEHDDDLSDGERDVFDDLIEVLELFGPAGEFFKAHYLQWELVNLSRHILYTGIPSLLVSITAALYLRPMVMPGEILGVDTMVWLVSAGVTLALVPFFVFAAYVLRIATIAKVAGALGPFVLHEFERDDLIEWDE